MEVEQILGKPYLGEYTIGRKLEEESCRIYGEFDNISFTHDFSRCRSIKEQIKSVKRIDTIPPT